MVRQIFNEVLRHKDGTPENMEKNTRKNDLQKRVSWRRLVTTARFILRQHCTIVFNGLAQQTLLQA